MGINKILHINADIFHLFFCNRIAICLLYTSFYDADWQECSKDEASYEIVIRVEPDGKLLHGTFTVQRLSGEQPEEIYSVETDRMTGTERE